MANLGRANACVCASRCAHECVCACMCVHVRVCVSGFLFRVGIHITQKYFNLDFLNNNEKATHQKFRLFFEASSLTRFSSPRKKNLQISDFNNCLETYFRVNVELYKIIKHLD